MPWQGGVHQRKSVFHLKVGSVSITSDFHFTMGSVSITSDFHFTMGSVSITSNFQSLIHKGNLKP